MNILVIDDERLLLEGMKKVMGVVFPQAVVWASREENEMLATVDELHSKGETINYAFLDMHLCEMSGIEFAKRLKEKDSNVKIFFCTAYSNYACQTGTKAAPGYILKPVTVPHLMTALELVDELETSDYHGLILQTFGDFEVRLGGKVISFANEKELELLALLTLRRGGEVAFGEIGDILWPGEKQGFAMKSKLKGMITNLEKTLVEAGAANVLIHTRKTVALNRDMVSCDLYRFEQGDFYAINSYKGKFMEQYDWARFRDEDLASVDEILR